METCMTLKVICVSSRSKDRWSGGWIHDPEAEAATTAAQAVQEAARIRTLTDYNRPDGYYANRSSIRPPAIERNDFELKPQYTRGTDTLLWVIPWATIDHLERFEDLVYAIKVNGVPANYLFCKLFKYSLAREASQWLKQLPPGSLTSWDAIKNAFLQNFFDDPVVEDLRSKIATFAQEPT